jgi:hypothetical protein
MQNRMVLIGLFTIALGVGAIPGPAALQSAAARTEKSYPAPDPKVNAKVNHIILLMNHETGPLMEARDGWLQEVRDPAAGPTCKEQNLNAGPGFGSDAQTKFAEYRKQFHAKPKLEVDEAVLQMVDALEQLQKTTDETNEVLAYRNKNKPDRCAKLKQLHPLLMAGWQKYHDGLSVLEPFIEQFTDERDHFEAEKTLKKYGKHYRYHFARIILEAKGILHKTEIALRRPDADTTPILDRLARISDTTDEIKQAMAADNAANKNDTYPPSLSLLVSDSMPRFQKEVKTFVELLKDKTKRANPKFLKPEWKRFVDDYNGLVEEMNGVGFSKNQK